MKSTEAFKTAIFSHLEERAKSDELFAYKFNNPKKNIDDCITYILNQVKASGCNGFADEEIYGMAVHYYDEDNIEVGKPISARVVVNHTIPSAPTHTEEHNSTKSRTKHKKVKNNIQSPTLFDEL